MIDQQRNVLLSFPERRLMNGEDVETIAKMLVEGSARHGSFDVAVSRREDVEIELAPGGRADRTEFALLHEPEKLHLHLERQVASFVKEGSAAVSQFH
ncbi:MAG TPA: hypothetical protein VKB88_13065 [Bryobacteraceae bacterium]|nr:hypothetical protein [Bryobacteraceae bacterium]